MSARTASGRRLVKAVRRRDDIRFWVRDLPQARMMCLDQNKVLLNGMGTLWCHRRFHAEVTDYTFDYLACLVFLRLSRASSRLLVSSQELKRLAMDWLTREWMCCSVISEVQSRCYIVRGFSVMPYQSVWPQGETTKTELSANVSRSYHAVKEDQISVALLQIHATRSIAAEEQKACHSHDEARPVSISP